MKRLILFAGLIAAVLFTGIADVSAAKSKKSAESKKARMKRLLDTDGDGVISIPERGAARVMKAASRQQRALNKNERVLRGIK